MGTHNREVDEATVAAHIDRSASDHVGIAVSDTGTGMDAERIAHAFEPFFTAKPMGQGAGHAGAPDPGAPDHRNEIDDQVINRRGMMFAPLSPSLNTQPVQSL